MEQGARAATWRHHHDRRVPRGEPLAVLHVTQPVDGGVARVVTDLLRAQRAAGFRTALACPPFGDLMDAARAIGTELHRWPATREPDPGLPAEIAGVARVVRDTTPDVVHLHSAKAGLAGRLAVRGRVATVFQPHAWSFDAVSGGAARLALEWERRAARWTTRVLCVSEAERRRGVNAGVDGAWAVVPNGVDTTRFSPATAGHARDARARLAGHAGVPEGALLAVCVGRLCRQKGQDVLLRAWPAVTARLPDAYLAVVGEGPTRDALRRSAPAQVMFPGATDDPASWYAAAELVIQPSRWEGMALAPLEAMASGRPVLLGDVGGARESLPEGHAATCLVPPEDAAALADATVRLLADRPSRDALGRQASRHVHTTRDVRDTTRAVAALYRALVDMPQPHHAHEDLMPR